MSVPVIQNIPRPDISTQFDKSKDNVSNDDYKLPQKPPPQEKDEIVISGISGRYPESDNIKEFWDNLVTGADILTSDDRRWPVGE